jgi:protein-S-isoprenylcysteine O-methyltransferase Ste14
MAPALSPLDAEICGAEISSWRAFKDTKLYDVLAAAPLTAWYAASAWQRVPSLVRELSQASLADADAKFILNKLAEAAGIALILAVLVFLLLRGPAKARTPGLLPRVSAIFGTYLGLAIVFLPYRDPGLAMSSLSLFLILGGFSFSVYALGYLGRSFSIMAEARQLVTTGPYSVIRHPLYLGEAAATIGLMLQYFSPLAVAIVALQIAFQLNRIANEERILAREFPAYNAYMARSARFIPGVY